MMKNICSDDPILITGAPRSGTSMAGGIHNICGAWGGEMAGPNRYNKRGMFENNDIRNDIIKPFLRNLGCDPLGQNPLPDIGIVDHLADGSTPTIMRMKIQSILGKQGYPGGRWFYKGAKMCLIWPIWHTMFPRANWIIVRRKDDDIVSSCLKTGFMQKYHDAKGWHIWLDQHLERFQEMDGAGLNIFEIWPQKMINGDLSEIKRVITALGLTWKKDKVVDFISPALWSSGISKKEVCDGC